MKKNGVIGNLGLSLQHNLVMKEDYYQVNQAKEFGINVVQTVLNKFSQDSLSYVVPFCKENNLEFYAVNCSFPNEDYDPKKKQKNKCRPFY